MRSKIATDREVLLALVVAVLNSGGPSDPTLRTDFEAARRKLDDPVPRVNCQAKFR